MLQQRHAPPDIAAPHYEVGKALVRHDGDKIAALQVIRRTKAIEPDRRAGGGVPQQLHRHGDERCGGDAYPTEIGHHDISEAGHPSILRRLSQA